MRWLIPFSTDRDQPLHPLPTPFPTFSFLHLPFSPPNPFLPSAFPLLTPYALSPPILFIQTSWSPRSYPPPSPPTPDFSSPSYFPVTIFRNITLLFAPSRSLCKIPFILHPPLMAASEIRELEAARIVSIYAININPTVSPKSCDPASQHTQTFKEDTLRVVFISCDFKWRSCLFKINLFILNH